MSATEFQQMIFRLPVSDLQRSIEFYVSGLGLQLSFGPEPVKGYYSVGIGGGTRIAFDERAGARRAPEPDPSAAQTPLIELAVIWFYKLHQRLSDAGLAVGAVQKPESNSTHFLLRDPDGHLIRLNQVRRSQILLWAPMLKGPDSLEKTMRAKLRLPESAGWSSALLIEALTTRPDLPPRKICIEQWDVFADAHPREAGAFEQAFAGYNAAVSQDQQIQIKLKARSQPVAS